MAQINSYLTFSGNCLEAMNFYRDCLGGELTVQKLGESPLADKLPQQMKECVMHSTLTKGPLVLMGTDMVDEDGLVKGNSVSLMIDCSSEAEINTFYKKLSAGGNANHPVQASFRGALFGDLTDKYGNHWLLHFDKEQAM